MSSQFFRCINCKHYSPGTESCLLHNIDINSELNICSMHSSMIYKNMKKNTLYRVEETLLESLLIKDRRISQKKESKFLCSNCVKKISKVFLPKKNNISIDEEIFNSLVEIIISSSANICDSIFSSELCEKEEFQEILNNIDKYNFNHKKILICSNCYKKLENEKFIDKNDPINLKIFKLLKNILEK